MIVGTVLGDGPENVPVGFDLTGEMMMLSQEHLPPIPTISVVPAEAFNDQGVPYSRSGTQMQLLSVPAPQFDHRTKSQFTGAWVTEIHTGGDYEGALIGTAEFVMYLHGVEGPSPAVFVCANERGDVTEPFQWDMNYDDYYEHFLIVPSNVPEETQMSISLYEDDDERCVIRTDKDFIKITLDAIVNAGAAFKALVWLDPLGAGLNIVNATRQLIDLFQSEDEFVGVVAPDHAIDGTVRQFYGRDEDLNRTIRLKMVWDTRAPE